MIFLTDPRPANDDEPPVQEIGMCSCCGTRSEVLHVVGAGDGICISCLQMFLE
jgi:hypothetical protein